MPICNYFINGSCRFGSKCNNDHIDLKTLLKTEVDSVINGKQWLLSCLGPFKESVCIPNFITDQSFEEVRLGFMESSKNGTLQQYIGNLLTEINQAASKLNELKMASNDTIQVMIQIYNNSTEQKSSNQPGAVKPSAFGSSTSSTAQNPFGAGIFGSSNQPAMSTSNIFGGSNNSASSFQQSSSIFGASNEQKSTFSFAQPKPSVFGQSSSIFGATQSPQAHQSSSIFGDTQGPQAQQSSSIFGATQGPQAQQSSSIFGATQSAHVQQSSSIFGGISSPQPPQQSSSIFGGPSSSTFGGSSFAPQQPQQSIFGATNTNIFQQAAQTQSTPFGQIQSPHATNVQQSSSNIFCSSMMQAQPAQSIPSQNIFGIQQPTQNPIQQQPSGSLFTIQQPTTTNVPSSFGGNPFQPQVAPTIPESAYSKLEDLTPEELQQFQAAEFTLGQIPLKPPAQNLCL